MNLDVHQLWLRILSANHRLDEAVADAAGLMVGLAAAGETGEAEALGRDTLVGLEVAVARILDATHGARRRHDARGKD